MWNFISWEGLWAFLFLTCDWAAASSRADSNDKQYQILFINILLVLKSYPSNKFLSLTGKIIGRHLEKPKFTRQRVLLFCVQGAPCVGIWMKVKKNNSPTPKSSSCEKSKFTHPVDDPCRVDILRRKEIRTSATSAQLCETSIWPPLLPLIINDGWGRREGCTWDKL